VHPLNVEESRIFLRDGVQVTEELRLTDPPLEPEDEARHELLHRAFQCGVAHGVAHPGIDLPDVMDVYVTPPDTNEPVFACVVVTPDRLESMLVEAPIVVEDICLQVAEAPRLTPSAIRDALEAWTTRTFPQTSVQFNVDLWSDTTNDFTMLLFPELLVSGTPGDDLPVAYRPGATIERPWDEAA
jgi:hypothetical protein